MTTIDSAARLYARKPSTLASITLLLSVALSGCGTSTPTLFGNADSNILSPGASTPAVATAPQAASTKVAIAPVIGAPDGIGKQIQSQLGTALAQRNIGLSTSANDGAAYTLRGYVVSSREATGTKVSYIWDVTDAATGKRVNRITGEELAPISTGRDPWQNVSGQITQAIASKTAGSLAAWLPTQAARPSPAIANNSVQPAAVATQGSVVPTATTPGVANAPPVQNAAVRQGGATANGPVAALIPAVVGAPGDGGVSLTSAIQRELTRNGVGLASSASSATAYRVEGKVKLGAGKGGKQPIQIDWHVKDPKGNKLGTVSQKNEIPQGSLDGAWGQTANAAAAAAAQGILKLLPKNTGTGSAPAPSGTF